MQGGRSGWSRRARAAVWLAASLVVLAPACASPPVVAASRGPGGTTFEHTRLGYRLSDPSAPSPGSVAAASAAVGWRRIQVDGADLAFRSGEGRREATMIVASRCGEPDAELRVLARHLLIGTGPRERVESGPAAVAGGEAWVQWVQTRGKGSPVRIKTVTTRLDGCLVDWVLAGTAGFDDAVPDFDRWWASFERPVREDPS